MALAAGRSYGGLLVLAIAGGGILATLYPLSVAHVNHAYAPVEQVPLEPIAQTTPVVGELDQRAGPAASER